MNLNKLYKNILAISLLVFLSIPAQTHAAYSWPQIHSLWQDPASISNTPPAYTANFFTDPTVSTAFMTAIASSYPELCTTYASLQGYTDTADITCVYDSKINHSSFGSSFSGSGGSATNSSLDIYGGSIYLYIGSVPTQTYTQLESQLQAAWSAWGADTTAPTPTNPDVCDPHSEKYYPFSAVAYGPAYGSEANQNCNIYHNVGGPTTPPIASLSANPTSIVQGSNSALTYSCTNSATSASVDNGVGAQASPASGTVSVTPSTTTNYTLTCTNANGSSQASAQVTVQPSTAADLVASSVSPTTATAGIAGTLSSTASNSGTAASGSFPVLFQISTSPSGGYSDVLQQSSYIGPIPSGGTAPSSSSYTFPSAGTYYARACANQNTARTNIVTESNYANNCGAWTTITVSAVAQPAPSCTFTNPSGLTLAWSCTNATSCTGGGFSTGFGSPTSGSATAPSAGTYTLSCPGPGGTFTQALTIGGTCSGTKTGTITAAPARVKSGTATVLTVSNVTNVQTSCIVSGPGVSQTIPANSCTVTGTNINTPNIVTQSTYLLTCDGTEVNKVIVNVLPRFVEF